MLFKICLTIQQSLNLFII
uniref:Uncharacterized protein n=1 Tax=Anguilla anguilla TaxID=7936 RepID=A0A0E9TZE2_ANGAN